MATLNQEIVVASIARKVRKGQTISVSGEMRAAGYSKHTSKKPSKITKSKGFQELLDKYLPETKLMEAAKEGLGAVFTDKYNTDEPDYAVRHKYIETGLKLRGRLKDNDQGAGDTTNNFLIIGGDQLKRIASRVLDGNTASEGTPSGLPDSDQSEV